MMITRKITFGEPLDLHLSAFGPSLELEAVEFVGGAPHGWRIAPLPWRSGLHAGHPSMRGFHDLQFPTAGGTRSTKPATIETVGIGDAILHVWLRDGTYADTASCR